MLSLLAACAPVYEVVDTGWSGDVHDSGGAVSLALPDDACTVPADADQLFGELELSLSPSVTTVVHASWNAVLGDRVHVVHPGGPDRWVELAPHDDVPYDAVLLGLKPETTYAVQLLRETTEGPVCSAVHEVTTGALPSGLPAHELEVVDEGEGFLLVPSHPREGGGWVTLVDADGDVVWYTLREGLRARISLDGRAVLLNDFAFDPDDDGTIIRVELDGTGEHELRVPGAHMDFVEVAPDTFATFGWERDEHGSASGETLVRVEPDGTTTELWRASDDLGPPDHWSPGRSEPEMWAHLNHLEHDDGAYYVVSRERREVYRIPADTGRVDWTLGPTGGDFAVADGGAPLDFDPHSAVPTPDGLLLFDTGSPRSAWCSAALEYALDLDTMDVGQRWLYATDDCQVSDYLGNAVPLWNGHRLLVLAMSGQIDEVDADGRLVSRLRMPEGWWISYATKVPTL